MTKLPEEVQEALHRLAEGRNRILRFGIPDDSDSKDFQWTDTQAKILDDVHNIGQYVDYLSVNILNSAPPDEKARMLLVLNVLMLTLEMLFRIDLVDGEVGEDVVAQLRARMERARSAINRKPAGFFTEIVAQVFREHVEANGPWTDRLSKLARKLKPEIDRRAAIGGGTELEVDTITRRLKALITPSQH